MLGQRLKLLPLEVRMYDLILHEYFLARIPVQDSLLIQSVSTARRATEVAVEYIPRITRLRGIISPFGSGYRIPK